MSCTREPINKTIYRKQTVTWVLTVFDENDEELNLDGHILYLRVKNKETDGDPAIVILASGTGITHRTQSGTDIGKADIVITSAQTALLTATNNVYDVWVLKPSGAKEPVIPVSKLTVLQPVTLL